MNVVNKYEYTDICTSVHYAIIYAWFAQLEQTSVSKLMELHLQQGCVYNNL